MSFKPGYGPGQLGPYDHLRNIRNNAMNAFESTYEMNYK